jgi:PIN domain nuclease of toxin-antitoxin system
MKVLVDTEVLLALLSNADGLSKESREALDAAAAKGELCVSVASLLQIREAQREKLLTSADLKKLDAWMYDHETQVLPIDARVIASMSSLHKKQQLSDRLLLATARREDCCLATFRKFNDPNLEFLICTRA